MQGGSDVGGGPFIFSAKGKQSPREGGAGEEDKREVHFLLDLVGASWSCQKPRRGPEGGTRLTMGKGYSSLCKGHWLM